MRTIQRVIETTERQLNRKMETIQKKIDYSPFEELIEVGNKISVLLKSSKHFNESEYNRLVKERERLHRDMKKVLSANYLEKLFNQKEEVKEELRELIKFKSYVYLMS